MFSLLSIVVVVRFAFDGGNNGKGVNRVVQGALGYMRIAAPQEVSRPADEDEERQVHNVTTASGISNYSTAWAYHESYGIIDDVLDSSWAAIREHARTFYQYQSNRREHLSQEHIWYIFNLQPNLNCPHLMRVGGHGDGPKWTCNPLRLGRPRVQTTTEPNASSSDNGCLIYSVGSAGVYTWEDTLVEMLGKETCEIHVFDPNKRYARANDTELRNIHYHAWGLKSSYDTTNSSSKFFSKGRTHVLKTFPEMVQELGHEDRHIDIFKIDCEGCEWYTYKDWIGHDIGQISIEVHGVPGPASSFLKSRDINVWEFYDAFTRHRFAMYAKEPNAYSCGRAVEFSFLKMHPDFWRGAPVLANLTGGTAAAEPEKRHFVQAHNSALSK